MKISTRVGYSGPWEDFEVILPCKFFTFNDYSGYEGFSLPVKANDGYKYVLRIVERNRLCVIYMDQFYDMMNPKDYLKLKNTLETEIAMASLA